MDNKNIKAVIAIGVIIFLVIIGIAVFANMGPADNTVADQTEAQVTEPVAPDINYGEISTEQIAAGAVEGPEGFEAEPVEHVDEETVEEPVEPVDENPVDTPVYVFRNEKLLNEHYEKHGIEMGFASAEEYQAAASAVITNPDSLFKIEADDGDGVYYLEATNEFVVLSTDGYIRTYFLPSSGKAYFDRQ